MSKVGLRYGGKQAFKDISLTIRRGSITALIGPSGCGKTSFLMCLNRLSELVPECSVSGEIKIDGENIFDATVNPIALRRRVGMIFQKPNPFPLSIKKNMELPLREHGLKDSSDIERRIQTALQDVGLWEEVKDRLHTPALSLSGGQQQRLCIARALILSPEVLLMDEPCSALDPISSAVVEDLIRNLRGKYTVLIVTHNLSQARRVADHVVVFWVKNNCGTLIEYGTEKQVFETPLDSLTADYVNGIRG